MTTGNAACCTGGTTATVALLCCLSVGPVVAGLSAVGLGFLLKDAILVPLFVAGWGITLWGLWLGRRVHGRLAPLGLGAVGGVAALAGVFVAPALAYAGIGALLLAVVWSMVVARHVVTEERGTA